MALPEDIMARELSPQAAELVLKMRIAYKGEGKSGAAENYPPVLRKFLLWSESAGHAANTLPAESIEAFLDAYNSPTLQSRDILRSQLKSICNKITSEFGINLSHLEFRKPEASNTRSDRRARQASRAMSQQSQEADIMAAAYAAQMEAVQPLEEMEYDMMEGNEEVSVAAPPVTEAYGLGGAPMAHHSSSITPQVLVVQAPIAEGDPVPAQSAREKNARKAAAAKAESQASQGQAPVKAASPVNSFIVNGVAFRGAYTRISRLADGLEPGVMPGSETILFVTPTSTIARSGDAVQYLQQFVLPQLRFHPNATQVTFILEELTEKRQTTGVRMEVSVGLTNFNASTGGNASGPQALTPHGYHAPAPAAAAPSAADPTLSFLLRNMEGQISEARRREADVAAKLEKESNTMMQMQLMQMQQRAADDRRAMEERMLEVKMRADMSGYGAGGYGGLNGVNAAPVSTPMPDFFSQPAQPNPAEMLKPVMEQMGAMTQAMMQFAMRPPAPQKDAMETVLPIIMSMNQQMQVQAQASADRQMQFMQALMTQGQKETPTEKFLTSQLQYMEKRLENKESNGSDFDRALGMILKLKQVAPEIIGGGGGSGGLLEMLVENADGILGGAAKLLGAANGGGAPRALPAPQQAQQRQQQQLPPAQQDDAVPVKRAPKAQAATVAPVEAAPMVEAVAEVAAEQPATPPEQVPQENPLTPIVTQMLAIVEEDEFDTEPLIESLKVYFTTLSNISEQHQQIAGQIMTAFETADVYEDVYEVAKFICATAGIASRGKHVRDLAQSIHGVYSDVYANFFEGKEKTLSDVEEDEEGGGDEAEGAAA